MQNLSMTSARDELAALPDRLAQRHEAVAVTRAGKPVLAILPWELYESIAETLDILADDALMTAVRDGIRDADEGRTLPWEQVRADLAR